MQRQSNSAEVRIAENKKQTLRENVWRVCLYTAKQCKLVQLSWKSYSCYMTQASLKECMLACVRDTCTSVFIAELFTIATAWNQSRHPWTDEWIKKTVEFCSHKTKKKFCIFQENGTGGHHVKQNKSDSESTACFVSFITQNGGLWREEGKQWGQEKVMVAVKVGCELSVGRNGYQRGR